MDQWLAAVKADGGSGDLAQKIIRDRPAQANDRCGTQDGTSLSEFQCIGVVDESPRMAAGEDIHDDIVECQLKPMNRSNYTVSFTDAQWAQLQSVFPGGVCDYSQPDAGQGATQPWQTYMDANGVPVVGGTPLPPPPPGSPGT